MPLKRFKSLIKVSGLVGHLKLGKDMWVEAQSWSSIRVHVVTVMLSKFNAGSRCDKGQENDTVPLLTV